MLNALRVRFSCRGHKKIGQLDEADVLDYMRRSSFCMEQTDCASIFRAIYYEVYQVSAFQINSIHFQNDLVPPRGHVLGEVGDWGFRGW